MKPANTTTRKSISVRARFYERLTEAALAQGKTATRIVDEVVNAALDKAEGK